MKHFKMAPVLPFLHVYQQKFHKVSYKIYLLLWVTQSQILSLILAFRGW